MATLNPNSSKLDFDKSFHRLNGQPLDANSIFNSPEEARTYASSSTSEAYVGQYIAVKTQDETADKPAKYSGYIIADKNGTLKPTTYTEGKNISISTDGEISASGTLDLELKFDAAKQIYPIGVTEIKNISAY